MLPDDIGPEAVAGFPCDNGPGRPEVAVIDAPLRDCVVVEAVAARQRARSAKGQCVGDGHVDHALQAHRLVIADLNLGVETEILRSEEHTSELQSLMRISYAVL